MLRNISELYIYIYIVSMFWMNRWRICAQRQRYDIVIDVFVCSFLKRHQDELKAGELSVKVENKVEVAAIVVAR